MFNLEFYAHSSGKSKQKPFQISETQKMGVSVWYSRLSVYLLVSVQVATSGL